MRRVIPVQVERISIVAITIVAGFLVVRSYMVPESFGQYGHYRGAAVAENAEMPTNYAGEEVCLECHAGIDEAKIRSAHSPVRCEVCHGPLKEHALSPAENEPAPVADAVTLCLRCHEANPTRPPAFPQVDPKEHRPGIECIGCHDPHSPKEESP